MWAVGAGLIEKIYRQNGFGDAADLDVAHEDILDHAAALGVRFEAQRAVEVRAVHIAVFDEDVAHAARNLAAHHDSAVAVLHHAISDDDIFGRRGDAAPVVVPARFDGDAIVAGVEDAIFDQNILTGFRITPVV